MTGEIERRVEHAAMAPLDQQMDYARAVSAAGLLPAAFHGQPANVLIALEAARALDESPWTVMQEMAVISGKPSFSAKFMRARVRQAGHRLRESFEDGTARCVIIRHDDPDFEHVATWDKAKAERHGYWGKGHWQKNPELMLRNRALSECVREACYEVMAGVGYTPDEVADFAPQASQMPQPPAPHVPDFPEISACTDVEQLRAWWQHSPGNIREVIEARVADLQAVDAEVVDADTGEVQAAFPEGDQ